MQKIVSHQLVTHKSDLNKTKEGPKVNHKTTRGLGCFVPGTSATDDILAEEWREAMVAHIAQVLVLS